MYDEAFAYRYPYRAGHGGGRRRGRGARDWAGPWFGGGPVPWGPPGPGLPALHQAVLAIAAAAREVARDGDQEKTAKAAELLNEARKAMYRLLTGDTE